MKEDKEADGYQPISGFERTRRAPFHFLARADNARFSAYLLSHAPIAEEVLATAEAAGYGGSPSIAIREGFDREASIALKLIVKAVIAQRLEVNLADPRVTKVPGHHEMPQLWRDVSLPGLPPADYGRLVIAKVILRWAGCYPAPMRDEEGLKHDSEIWRHAMLPVGNLKIDIRKRISFEWDDVARIYGIAASDFWRVRREAGLSE